MLKLYKYMLIIIACYVIQHSYYNIFYFITLKYFSKSIERTFISPKVNYSNVTIENMTSASFLLRVELQSKSVELPLKGNSDLFGQNITHQINSKLLLSPHNICKPECPYLLILVPSVPSSVKQRKAIRETYGSLSNDRVTEINGTYIRHTVRVVFLFGTSASRRVPLDFVKNEHWKYDDIVQYDFEDSYYNLSMKILHGFKWISEHCNNSTYVLKIDEDTFVNTALLLQYLDKSSSTPDGAVYGCIYRHRRVLRYGKWKVPTSSFPRSIYPDYVSGTAYILTSELIPRIVELARHYRSPLVTVEDAFITGILATETLGAKLVALPGCSSWGEVHLKACDFVKARRIAQSVMLTTGSVKYKYEVWRALSAFSKTCN